MSWSPDSPLEKLQDAARVFAHIRGNSAYLDWLEQEASRIRVGLRSAGWCDMPQAGQPVTNRRDHDRT